MVIGITHGKNKTGSPDKKEDGGNEDIARQNSSRTDIIVMRFIEGPKKN